MWVRETGAPLGLGASGALRSPSGAGAVASPPSGCRPAHSFGVSPHSGGRLGASVPIAGCPIQAVVRSGTTRGAVRRGSAVRSFVVMEDARREGGGRDMDHVSRIWGSWGS